MATHSCVLSPDIKRPLSAGVSGKYGRMFPLLHSHQASETALLALGKAGLAASILMPIRFACSACT